MGEKKFTDIELIETLRNNQGNVSASAKDLGVSRQAITKRRANLPKGLETADVTDFRKNRATTFASLQQILLQYITPEKLKKASIQQLGTLFGIMYDKERLERNLATEHIAHAHFQKLPPDQMASIRKLAQELTERKLNQIIYEEPIPKE